MMYDELIEKIRDLEDKLDHVEKLIDLEWNGSITAKHCIERIAKVILTEAENNRRNNENS
jgi:hypothetical protein